MPTSDPIDIPDGVPEDAVDALYGLPLDEFTPRRDELSKELRGTGKRDEAAWVKALRKPSATAWLVNQLARTQKSDARRVLDSGNALRTAQERALAGKGSRDELSGAAEEHAGAMRELLSKAPGLLDRKGASPSNATLERAAETLRAIPLDDEARAGFAAGRLTREHRAAGLGFAAPGTPHRPTRKPAKAAAPKTTKTPKRDDEAAERRAKERERVQALVKQARALRSARQRDASELERHMKQAQRELERAQRRLEKAEDALKRGRQRLEEAKARAAEVEAAAKRN